MMFSTTILVLVLFEAAAYHNNGIQLKAKMKVKYIRNKDSNSQMEIY